MKNELPFKLEYGDLVTLVDGFENIVNNIDDLMDVLYNPNYEIVKVTRDGKVIFDINDQKNQIK